MKGHKPDPKIICTLGTTTDSKDVLEDMVKHGMRCARMNTAYATIEDYQSRLDQLREVADIDVMMDIKGPQVRLEADHAYYIGVDDILYVGFRDEPIHFSKDFFLDVGVNDHVLIENGTIDTVIHKKERNMLALKVVDPGEGYIHKQMGVNVPGKYLQVPRLSKKDEDVIDFSVRNNVEYIALSFVRDFSDVDNLWSKIGAAGRANQSDHKPGIIAKIEDSYGIGNLQDIITRCKIRSIPLSVMVARGDLYVELPKGELPFAQKQIISTCNKEGVFVITATGILESMQNGYEPTRAEVCDVYNAIAQGSDALMFSGETSNGHDPAGAVRMLNSLIKDYARNLEVGKHV